MKTIVLVDPFDTGHHESYMVMFSGALLFLGYRVVALYPEPEKLGKYVRDNYPELLINFQAYKLPDIEPSQSLFSFVRKISDVSARWDRVRRVIFNFMKDRTYVPDLVFFCWLDAYLYKFLPIFRVNEFPFSWSGLYFHPWHYRGYPVVSWWKHKLHRPEKFLKAKNCLGMGILDEGIYPEMQHRYPDKKIVIFPDVADPSTPELKVPLIQDILDRANGRKIISILGYLSHRKGLLAFVELARSSKEEWFFVFAGELVQDNLSSEELNEIYKFVSDNPDNCYFHFQHIETEAVYNGLICISDLLYAVYNDFPSSSNILSKAALFKKPVIVSEEYLMGERTRKFNLGRCVRQGDIKAQSRLIKEMLDEKSEPEYGFDSYAAEHTFQRLLHSFKELILV